jgi:hypothetical protein
MRARSKRPSPSKSASSCVRVACGIPLKRLDCVPAAELIAIQHRHSIAVEHCQIEGLAV